jgi:hypothetical protein
MIKAISLIFEPAMTWEKIALARRKFSYIFLCYLTPLILVSVVGEILGVYYLGRRGYNGSTISLPLERIAAYGAAQLAASFLLVLIGAKLVQSVSQGFQGGNSYLKCFTVVAYTVSPLFLVRLLDAAPMMNPWASFGIGMALSIAILYQGVPRVLQPDPPDAFGVFLTSAFLLAGLAALLRFLTFWLLNGRGNLDSGNIPGL